MHQRRLWSWPGAPPILREPVPDSYDARFRVMAASYDRAVAARDSGVLPPIAELRAPFEAMLGSSSPRSRARRFFLQMTAELALIAGDRQPVLDVVEEAVEAGLLDLAWIRRLSLLDPLRADPRASRPPRRG